MFCKNCGEQLDEGTLFCTKCGARMGSAQPAQQYSQQYSQPYTQPYAQAYAQPEPKENPALAVCALVFSFLISIVGLILGIIGVAKYKSSHKGMCIAAIIISSISFLISAILAAIIVPSMLSYVNRSRQLGVDTTAAVIRGAAATYFVEADIGGYGIKEGVVQEFDVIVNDSKWTVTAANASNFYSTAKINWGERGVSDAKADEDSITSGEELLAHRLAKKYPDLGKASMHIVIKDGQCTALACTGETTSVLEPGVDYPKIDADGRFADVNKFLKNKKSKLLVGYSPLS